MNHESRNGKTRRQLTGFLACALIVASGAASLRAHDGDGNDKGDNKGSEVRLRTTLSGGAIKGEVPSGQADFRMESARNRSRLNVEVEDVNLPAGTMLQVTVTRKGVSTQLGTIKLDAFGAGELELNSQDGETVPAIMKGDVITVTNAGTVILTGVF